MRKRVSLVTLATAAVVVPLSVVAMHADAAVAGSGAVTGIAGKCLDVDHSGTANGTAVQVWNCNGTGAQSWVLAADGTVRAFGKGLDVRGSGIAAGTPTQLWDCNGSAAQQWLVSAAGDLVNPHANKCLDALGGAGTRLQIGTCSGAANQKWTPPARPATSKRLVVYYQTQYQGSTYFSPAELLDKKTGTTDVVLAAFHLNGDGSVHLNDDPPSAPKFATMWTDLARMQSAGVRVTAMVGGAAPGSFQRLDTQFDTYYPLLKNVISTYRLDGVDLDVEESMSLAGMERLIDQLRADFGDGFVITLAPVATAMTGGGNLSGFNYEQLYRDRGSKISWFNIQFYNGWGSIANTAGYDAIVNRGLIPPQKLVAGALTSPGNGGSGYVSVTALATVLRSLVAEHPDFGGVDGWEYFNSRPGNTTSPWQWAALMARAQGR